MCTSELPFTMTILLLYFFTIQNACEASLTQVLFYRRVININTNVDEIIAVQVGNG